MEDDVIVNINAMIENGKEGLLSPTCCIYRVPHMIRKLNKDAYTPQVVSIGPFHSGTLPDMQRHKYIFFERFIQEAKTALNDLVSFVKSSEPRVRECYSENISIGRGELVELILVDSGFIIQLFREMYEKIRLENDVMLSKPWLVETIIRDLLLLENQLPFSFLQDLYNIAFPSQLCDNIPSFLDLTYDFFAYYNKQNLEPHHDDRILLHFTDLLRKFHLQRGKPHSRKEFEAAGSHVLLYNANQLHEAGVKFKVNKNKCLLELKFSGRVFEVPQILVEDNRTVTLFRNMLALEQCHYPFDSYITDYALILDCLINTTKDVDVLIHEGIIHNYLGDSNDVVKVFKGLGKNIAQANFNSDYFDICKRLNEFYKDPWHEKKATLRRDYCKTPWQTAASIAGMVLLILSLIQTICSVLQVAK